MAAAKVNWTTVRRWDRYHVDIRFKAILTKYKNPVVLFGQGTDVSEGGMAAYIPTVLAVSETIELEFALPYLSGQKPIHIRAVVRNCNGFRYGLEYVSLTDADRELLLKSLTALSLAQ
jgi:c-di-GMP-binding flagellar brake protein YcgR